MFVLHNDTVKNSVGNGVSRQILAHSGSLMAVEVEFTEGAIGPLHSHPHEQLTYVLAGEFKFTIGNESQVVKQGDTLYKRPNIMHGCVCLKAGKLLDIFTPIRDDFLLTSK
ncbi:cupin domain-containing protein [Salmonella enterica]|uniref:Cupin domain-containing protein n=1 Tax=Salmonella diarizonae TaxID=59204 RepID=A0A702DAI2_SALDZ|nr:cupin domain-containing protein [Salmonella enterica]EDW4549558.1 cupin domain-containing protein [Salmonella enterica subsp. salamae]EKR1798336.1 cupin domain-containing protein [Salmonella enterica subsp. diarizonae serovar 65:z10:e,n,x,z15]HCA3619678.1 cupin domain-containing protein [Salmonella enterica subsp. diarizonae serovar 61:i:z]EAN5734916.1 cupin domain-containing protein [Salmonella enterica]EAU4680440.1 cupin domain-containing protein [Salmonella enterica]